ncbi:hypothetical protein CO731_01447 [Aminobacter sp. MSH1]|uniref:hypothetical protein n=1 Tax=Aminobacter sp. MSH1 TaxID=374606 RepID=UPI000D504E7C|nr:hypothetical protein [Aminobacter sp. MSH1]AWC21993.1 hypothetical protein CO731_01447 [Aminobacter sp. MSH1]
MSSFNPDIFRAVRHYAGKIRTIHNEIRTERFLNSLPADLRKDIGWPDRFGSRRAEGN